MTQDGRREGRIPRGGRSLVLAALAFATLVTGLSFAPAPAEAQAVVERRYQRSPGLLDFIFRPRRRVEPRYIDPDEVERPPRAERRIKRRRPAQEAARPSRSRRAATVQQGERESEPEAPQAVEKAADAKTILVVGDFLGSGLAEGLEAAYAGETAVQVVDRTNGSSGFVREDHFDWPGELPGLIEEVKPDIVAVMIGSNDRQPLRVDGASHEELTPAWTTEYESRVEEFAELLQTSGKPFIWIGMPPFKSSSMSSDMLAFNDIYRRAAEEAGGQFVDIWDGFVDESGSFAATGPDINGQPVKLRGSDGINMTRQGRRKIAFYAEKPLARLVEPGQAPAAPLVGALPGAVPEQPAGPVDRTVPVALGGPELDGGSELLGARNGRTTPAADNDGTIGERLIDQGMVPEASAGRADDFRIERPSVAAAEEPSPSRASNAPRAGNAPAARANAPAAAAPTPPVPARNPGQ